jgi:4-hydroxybenzoate polyprenyltransferase
MSWGFSVINFLIWYNLTMNLKQILNISRPRFWLYEMGTYFIGVLVATSFLWDFLRPEILIFGFFFLIPANILIYGINDIFDYETDKLNPKKVEYESLLVPEKHRAVWVWILATNIPFLLYAFTINQKTGIYLLVFYFFASFYSATPIRAKIRPFFDSLFSAGHYIFTGVFGYFLAGGEGFPLVGFIAGILWAMAMHAYSAVPDIKADTDAGFKTIATWLGRNGTIVMCLVFYVASAVLFSTLVGVFPLIAVLVYVFLMVKSLKTQDDNKLFKIYTYFPWVNFVTPMVWSIIYMVTKFG